MKGRSTRFVSLAVVAAAILTIVGLTVYQDFYGQPARFNAEFYRARSGEKPAAFSNAPYAAALAGYADDKGMVNYGRLKADRKDLDTFLRSAARVEAKTYESWDKPTRIAFWINMYNALTLKAITDHYPIKASALRRLKYPANSIRQIPGVWDKLQFLVLGRKMTLNHIEHKELREKFNEPRIHVALVCAAMGCPPLRNEPYDGKKLDEQLDDQARKFLTDSQKFRIDRPGRKVHLSSIFQWLGEDFLKSFKPEEGFKGHKDAERAVLNFAARHLAKEDADFLRTGKFLIEYLKYDWSLNEQEKKKPDAPRTRSGQKRSGTEVKR